MIGWRLALAHARAGRISEAVPLLEQAIEQMRFWLEKAEVEMTELGA